MNANSQPAPGATTVWCITDNKPGHRNQLRGLTDTLHALTPLNVVWFAAPSPWASVGAWLRGVFPPGHTSPPPALILGAGHRTHWALLAARRARGGRAIVLMKSTLPTAWFDLSFIPEHDGATAGPRVVPTKGALHAVTPARPEQRQRATGVILIGGPSPHHRWDTPAVVEQIRAIVHADPSWQWELTTSRRTPATFLQQLGTLPNLKITPVEQTDRDWVAVRLARAAVVWVTEDSVSMIYEALTAGSAVGLLQVPSRRRSRVVRGVEQLVATGWVTPFAKWRTGATLTSTPATFHEAARCAAILRERFLT